VLHDDVRECVTGLMGQKELLWVGCVAVWRREIAALACQRPNANSGSNALTSHATHFTSAETVIT